MNNRLRQDSPGALASSPAGDRDCYIAGPFVPGLQETFHLPSRTGLPPVLRLPHQSEDRRDAGPALPAWFKIPSRDASIVDVFRSLLLGHLMLLSIVGQTLAVGTDKPLVNDALVFEEAGGQLVVEAEAFFAQTNTEKRAWYITTEVLRPDVGRDIDPPHFADAAGGAHIEVLPDTGNDPVGPVAGESISDQAGAMAVVSYHVHFNNPGRYYIWVRALGTDGDDNTLHFGMDGEWPTNSARMHHGGGGQWGWACRHRQHKGKLWLDVPGAGPRVIQLSMREDGCEVDRFILTTNETFTAPDGIGPTVRLRSGVLPDFSSARPSVAPAPGGIRIEAESAFADGWELATARPGFRGTGYLRWTGSGQGRKPGEGVLTYSFRITEPGDYQFLWRSALPDPANRPETPDPDGNDSWVRFTSGADVPGQRALGNEWRKVALLGHPEGWSWSTHADQGPPHPPTPVCRAYEPGEHRVEICGRSAGHAVDQIALRRFRDVPLTDTPGETLP